MIDRNFIMGEETLSLANERISAHIPVVGRGKRENDRGLSADRRVITRIDLRD